MIHGAADAERDLIQDAVWAKGLVPAGECFEMYGWSDRKAPPLKDSPTHTMGPDSDPDWDRDEKQRSLAACLASPFLFDNSNMGREVRIAHEQATAEEQERVRARYTTEVGEEEKRLEREVIEREADPLSEDIQQREGRLQSSYAGHQAMQRSRRKRQLEEELLAAQYSSGGVAAAPALLSTDPVTQKVLASVLGSLDDRSNRLELDRHELLRRSHDRLGLPTMDAPDHDDPFTLTPPQGYRDRGHHDKEAFDEGDFIAPQPTQNASLRTNTIPAMHGPPLSPINEHTQQTQPGRNLSNAVPFQRPAAKRKAGGRNAAKTKPHGPLKNKTPF
eukprot:jgi/Astpho2/6705/Aster-06728